VGQGMDGGGNDDDDDDDVCRFIWQKK